MLSKAENTRLNILQQAFALVYRNGYQNTSIDDIIATTQVTKGAFFYHFKNKDEMGLAMINEVMYPGMLSSMVTPLLNAKDPVKEIYRMMDGLLLRSKASDARYGCPAVNLVDEMSAVNISFQKALLRLFEQWQSAIQQCIRSGREAQRIRADVDERQVAAFVLAGYSGVRNMGKLLGRPSYKIYLKEFKNYLEKLR
ncbi:TetR/AcrR family transcriptional regulator [Mucilaginibacter daejeonensis]|uniref:TetR/AcrR family transcriptional regulator n=1 Tax=Mucilaginibacter daejeonensis TaxID=398049 RepID=UPI001D17C49D|nr:TetR/AcrR family transcriptional regulator [Mucilaginibacter daejeonensis]UEG51624.1 TetR/AcrR family transcriptional regulator [Mucilaginibacter daejeonensis]